MAAVAPPGSTGFAGRRDTRHLLDVYGRGREQGNALRAQLSRRFAGLPGEEIEDAVQTACRRFLDKVDGISDPAAVYAWLHTTAYRVLLDELGRRDRTLTVDPTSAVIDAAVTAGLGPIEELIALEDEADLAILVEEVACGLKGRQREVLVLWAAGLRRPEIAAELGINERAVKRALEEIMCEARTVLARRAGGGCREGESLVLRFACGLAETGEALRARAHLEGCGRCSAFADELEAWRQRAGALLGPAAAEVASPGLVSRTVGRVGDAISSARRHVLEGGAQAKQAAAASLARTADPTPLAGIRPGAVAAVVAGCLAIGTAGATYCAQQGVDPLGAAESLIGGGQEEAPEGPSETEPAAPQAEAAPTTTYEPEPAGDGEETVAPPSHEESASASEGSRTEPEPAPEVTPPPEQQFEAASPDYPATESSSSSTATGTTSSEAASQPKAVPANEAPQFGGP